jgi:glycosyltransferase involved in cell wall biosynthesis
VAALDPTSETLMSSRGRLCFNVPQLYPHAAGRDDFIGGIEVLDWALARGLAERGFDVSIATCDYGQAAVERRSGVALWRTFSPEAGVPGFRFVYPRLWKTMRTLRSVNADVYLASGGGLTAGWAYESARLRGSRFVFMAASDKDVLRSLPALTQRRAKWWYLRALRGADAHIAQTERQRRLFHENFGIDADVIAGPVELPAASVDAGANDVILWLSTYKPSKRPDWFLELARRLPKFRFVMIGFAPSSKTNGSWQAANRAAADLPNLEVHGFVDQIDDFMRAAAVLVHTSPLEGFPNIFLEAWSYGVPSVTAVDPDGVVKQHGMGEVVETVEELAETVGAIMANPDRRRVLGAHARRYVEGHHGPDRTYEPLALLLDRVIEVKDRAAETSRIGKGPDSK